MIHRETDVERIERKPRGQFSLFVYGTLKRGYGNHDAYCGSTISVREATVRGRLYELPSGIPVLEVPDDDILAIGSDSVLDDMLRQDTPTVPVCDCSKDGWDEVHGELITLTDPADVEDIDRLEGFRPGRHNLYRRVLVPVATGSISALPAWCYVLGVAASRTIVPLGKNSWP